MKKILFCVNGLGLGNSTRCLPLIRGLEEEGYYSVDIMSAGKAYGFFKYHFPNKEIIRLPQPSYGINNAGELSMMATLSQLRTFFRLFKENRILIEKALKANNYSGVVLDSVYSLPLKRDLWPGALIAINNATDVLLGGDRLPMRTWGQWLIELMDSLYFYLFADIIISPRLKSSSQKIGKVTFVPPIVRDEIIAMKSNEHASGQTTSCVKNKPQKIVVMLSGSDFKTDLSFLESKEYQDFDVQWVRREGEIVYNNLNFLNGADLFIVNGGLSSLSEAAVMGKPCLIIPFKNHAEQAHNALRMKKIGAGVISLRDHQQSLNKLLKNFKYYQSFTPIPSGTKIAIKLIKDMLI